MINKFWCLVYERHTVCCRRGARGLKKGIIPEVEDNHLDSFRQSGNHCEQESQVEERLCVFESVVQTGTLKKQGVTLGQGDRRFVDF